MRLPTNGAPLVATNWRTNWELATYQRIRDDVSRIADVHHWIRAGFAPLNVALKGAGFGGVDIGAVPVAAIPVASGTFRFGIVPFGTAPFGMVPFLSS